MSQNGKEQDIFAVRVSHAAVRFNMASERVDNLKEYFIKQGRSVGHYWNKWFWKVDSFKADLRYFKTLQGNCGGKWKHCSND